jgi:hypothetical protein
MAKKKTTVQELQELIEATPKAHTLTEANLELLREISESIADVRHTLSRLQGEDNISNIMFEIGSSFRLINDSEDKLIYGLDTINQSQVIQIVEGPIDSLFLNNTIASGDANLNKTAESMNVENVVLVFDNEPRNKEIVKMVQTAIKAGRKVVIWPDTMQGKDINEMIQNGVSAGEVQDIISNNTFQGVKANLKFNYWKKI